MTNVKSQLADSNLIASVDWEIPYDPFLELIEAKTSDKTQTELKGRIHDEEFLWCLYLLNDGTLRLSLDTTTTTTTADILPKIYYELKLGGTIDEPFLCRTGPISPDFDDTHQHYTYGTVDLFTITKTLFDCYLQFFMPKSKLNIGLKLLTLNDAPDVDEIKVDVNPPSDTLVNDLKVLLTEPKHSDVTIICSGGVTLKAHKCILAARSPVFAEMFESAADKVTIVDVDVSAMKAILQFIYTGEVSLTADNQVEVMRCAEKYELTDLKIACLGETSFSVAD